MKCSISNIANVISESIPNPAESGFDIFVGLEHYDSGEVKITRYGSTQNLVTAVKVFRKGDILLARRNVYLKRAGLVDFDGVTSGDSIVLRVKDDLSSLTLQSEDIRMYLPFVLNTEEFWNYAEKYSDGTMSKRLSPKTLLQYEFDIPDDVTEKNRLLWQAYKTKESYKAMITATDEMVKSQFIEMFGESFSSNATIPLSEMVQDSRPITYGVIKPGDFVEDGVVLVRVKDIVDGKILLADLRKITSTVAQNYLRSTLSPGDILLSIRGTIGRTAIVPKELDGANITQDTARISLREEFNNHFIKCVLDSPVIQSWIQLHVKGLAVKGINLEDVRRIPIPSVKNELQEIYIALYHQADKSKFDGLKSQFIEMFGDPIENTKRWEQKRLNDLGILDRGVSRARPRNSSELLGGPYPLVQTGEVANCETYIKEYLSTYSEKGLAQSKMWPEGTLCITIAANIAKTGILTFGACFPDSVVGFIPNDEVNLLFIHHWFKAVQHHLEELAPSTAQKNMNLGVLSNLMIICPPRVHQDRFASIVKQADKSKYMS